MLALRGTAMNRWTIPWVIVGAMWGLGAISFIGVILLPVALIASLALAWVRPAQRAAPAFVAGLGLPLFYVAWLPREGPGTVCHAIRDGQECTDELNPLPWLAVGVALVICGIVAVVAMRRTRAHVREG
ncbi:MAG TPA: hypothetical protein VFR41_13345 [Acidimicrobiia bacterium]|nr:hypothetical protein [Acidimicrobiia bacterium]